MKNKYIIMAAAVATLVSFSSSVQATPITGGISFAGNYTPNNSDLSAATSIAFGSSFVTSDNGSFSGFAPGSAITLTPSLAINPTVVPVLSLWSIGIYSFDALTLTESGVTSTTLTLSGTGTIKDGTPADAVAGTWLATFNTLSGTFSYSASAGAAVPDGGSTVALLGGALMGLGLLKRKFLA
jgi:hypothetical protein